MSQPLPKKIDPLGFAQKGLSLRGSLPLSAMPRLVKLLEKGNSWVEVAMVFDIDEMGTPYMRGDFKASVSILCERCMQVMQLDIDTSCLLAILMGEQEASNLSDQYEPWVLEDSGFVPLNTIVEDELILSLPLVPKHEQMCLSDTSWQSNEVDLAEAVSPFSALKNLKIKR